MNNFFCVLPWISLKINLNGSTNLCCFNITTAVNFANEKKEVVYLNEHPIKDAVNSHSYNKLRLQMLNGEVPELCKRCLCEENSGGTSMRIFANSRNNLTIDDAITLTNGDGSVRSKPTELIFKFISKCNLKCRSCSNIFSQIWTDEYKKLSENLDFVKFYNADDDINILSDKKILKEIINYSGEINYINIIGGETTLIDEHWELLKLLIKENKSKNIQLWYNINCTYLPDFAFELWSQFKEVGLGLSIDDMEKRFEYLRKGARWETSLKIIKIIKEKIKIYPNINYLVTPAISWMSVYYLDRFYKFLNDSGINYRKNICIYDPNYLSPWILPESIKKTILQKIKTLMHENDYNDFRRTFSNKTDLNLLKQGIAFHKLLDKLRNESFEETFPELYNEIKKYWDDSN